MPNFPFVVSDSLQIGTATISATGNAIVLPAGTTVGATPVATTSEVATGGGPKITNLQITDATWAVLDDTAVDTAGGYVLVTGTNFVSGALVYFNQTPATSVAFVSATALRVTVPALAAATYIVYVINPDGGTAIRVPGLTASVNPAWQTASALPEQYDNVAITLTLVATDATSYTITSGSLPPGLSLNSNTGVITGTVTGITLDTVYTFTVRATDAQLQDSPRTFTVTIAVSDPYFKLTTLLLSGSALSANTIIKDSSTNNFNLTIFGDSRASNFTPYGTAWSVYFDGSGDYLTIPASANLSLGTNNFTMEFWMNATVYSRDPYDRRIVRCIADPMAGTGNGFEFSLNGNPSGGIGQLQFGASSVFVSTTESVCDGTWKHIAVTRETNTFKLFLNGNIVATTTGTPTITDGATYPIWIAWFGGTGQGHYNGYLSNFRIVRNEVLYTANFTPATSSLTSTSNTAVLTCHTSRFADSSANNLAITRTGDTRVASFNPFNTTNTGVTGSMYFDGTGDYVWTSDNAAFTLGTNNFTIECWLYNNSTGARKFIAGQGNSAGSDASSSFTIQKTAGNKLQGAIASAGPIINSVASSSDMPLNSWVHCAFVREGTTLRLYMNGVQVGTTTGISASVIDSSNNVVLGAAGEYVSADTWIGYIADFRIVNGTCLYPSGTSFTPPTTLLTAVTGTSLLTLQYDQPPNNHTFLDSSLNNFLITRNGNATQGTFSPFSQSGWSVLFNGTNNYISTTGFNLAASSFCIEVWFYFTSVSSGGQPLSGYGVSGLNYAFAITGGTYRLYISSDGTNWDIAAQSYGTAVANSWTHVAICRSGNSIRMYINGTGAPLITSSASIYNNSTGIWLGGTPNGGWMPGYGSNFRVVVGSAVYDTSGTLPSTITVPTTPLTAITNTQLLTCQANRFVDVSSTQRAITLTNSPSVTVFSPFAPAAGYNPVSHGGSVYLDGTGDYLNTVSDVGFNLGVGNFTWEFWTYLTASPADGNILFQPRTPAGIDAVLFGYKSGSNFTIYATTNGGSSWNLFSNTVIIAVADVLNRWAHWAFIRNGSTYTVYVDGISKVSGTSASQISQATNVFTLGAVVSGYFSGFRFVKAQALSTGNFTPPTAPLAANTIGWTGANVATSLTGTVNFLLNFTDAAIFDSTGRNVLETVADAKSSSVITKFTGGSMYFDGTGDWIITSQPPSFYNLPGNFTIEFWIYIVSAGGSLDIMGTSNNIAYIGAGQSGWVIAWSTTTGLRFGWQTNNTWSVDGQINSTNRIVNAWAHIAVVRNGSTITGYVNGSSTGSTLTSSANLTSTLYSLYIGAGAGNQGAILTGYLSDIRITQGYARYTGNFTAPTGPARLK